MASIVREDQAGAAMCGCGDRSGFELVPIPMVEVARNASGGFALLTPNRAYRLSRFGTSAARSPMLAALGSRITDFLAGADGRSDFAWRLDDAVDAHHYRVTLTRIAEATGRCAVAFVDQTGEQRAERSLRREMTTDSLTGLVNREGFGDLIEQASRGDAGFAVLVVDLTRFGRVNACLGGLAGDELLISVARRLKGALRAHDTLARIGGDEFGVLMAIDTDASEAHHLAGRLQRALIAPFRLTDVEINVEGAVGIAFGGGDAAAGGATGEEVVRHAQFALKRAKASGQIEAYQTRAFRLAREEFGLETALRRAVANDELHLTYQPVCDLASGRIVAFEALARWIDAASGREVEPARFIAVAEESGLIVPLGRWAIAEATRTLARWDAATGHEAPVQMAINVSPIQLQRDGMPTVVERALSGAGLAGARVKLELTESALVSDPERTAATMRSLKELGVTLALDDFGTGYSNLAYLQQLPIDILKIDRTFVTAMLADRDKLAIVRAVLGLAQALGMRTVAEGIETRELAQTLHALGCQMGQGFFYARPLREAEAWSLLTGAAAAS